jgi:hydrogenase-4 membrane subunit HyfE
MKFLLFSSLLLCSSPKSHICAVTGISVLHSKPHALALKLLVGVPYLLESAIYTRGGR